MLKIQFIYFYILYLTVGTSLILKNQNIVVFLPALTLLSSDTFWPQQKIKGATILITTRCRPWLNFKWVPPVYWVSSHITV